MLFEINLNLSYISVLVILGTLWLTGRYILNEEAVYVVNSRKNHSWKSVRILSRSLFCSICEIIIASNGLFCENCGIASDINCLKKAERQFKCKEKMLKEKKPQNHLWVHGNLPAEGEEDCVVCGEDIDKDLEPGLHGFRCAWCQRLVHDSCFADLEDEECDFGQYKNFIVPPSAMVVARTRGVPKLHLTAINPPDWPNWNPLIVIANTKSGSSDAEEIIALFRGLLNPLQVMELGSHGPADALQWAVKASPKRCKILVAGGDGTVGWVLNTISSLKIDPAPETAILPLGTGNDLSRVLGWGAETRSEVDPMAILDKIACAKPAQLDRWLVEINRPTRIPLRYRAHRTLFMYNYFSIGVDALVTLNFHKARESSFYIFSSRMINKLLYLCFGTHQVVQQDCSELEQKVELYLDGEKVELPELQSIVILNIDSWGAGVKLWEMSQEPDDVDEQSFSDGILEIFGISSSFHIAQLQVGLSKPIRLGRAKEVRLKLLDYCPVQADGEPWEQAPCEIKITKHSEATILLNNS